MDYFVFDLCFLFNSWWLCFDSAQLSPPDVPNDPCKSNCTWCFYLCWNVSRVIEYRAFVQKHDKIFGRKDACLYVFFFSVNEARHSHSTKTITTQRMKMKQNKSAKIRWVLFFNVIFFKAFLSNVLHVFDPVAPHIRAPANLFQLPVLMNVSFLASWWICCSLPAWSDRCKLQIGYVIGVKLRSLRAAILEMENMPDGGSPRPIGVHRHLISRVSSCVTGRIRCGRLICLMNENFF